MGTVWCPVAGGGGIICKFAAAGGGPRKIESKCTWALFRTRFILTEKLACEKVSAFCEGVRRADNTNG